MARLRSEYRADWGQHMLDERTILLKWAVDSDGYDILYDPGEGQADALLSRKPGMRIVPRGGSERFYEVRLSDRAEIFLEVANTKADLASVQAFAAKWGLPNEPYSQSAANTMPYADFLAWQANMTWVLTAAADEVNSKLKGRRFGAPQMSYDDGLILQCTLSQFCWFEWRSATEGGAVVPRCAECGTFMSALAVRGRNKTFCSSSCKQRHWRRQRNKEALTAG